MMKAIALSQDLPPSLEKTARRFLMSMMLNFTETSSSETKAIFYLCTYNNDVDYDIYSAAMYKIVKAFADEIIRCLRSNYDYKDYQRRVKIAKLKLRNR